MKRQFAHALCENEKILESDMEMCSKVDDAGLGEGSTFFSTNYTSHHNGENEEERRIGGYSLKQRIEKIQRYKNKLRKWRSTHPVGKKFNGRSKIAVSKPRVNGRFVKKEELLLKISEQSKRILK
jgi:hypothetical protein